MLGGPALYTEAAGGHSAMVEIHARMQAEVELDDRFLACFVGAFDDAGLPDDGALRDALAAYMEWAVDEVIAYSSAARSRG